MRLDWDYPVDLDLAAVCVSKDTGSARMVYHGCPGARKDHPWMKHTKADKGTGRAKQRWEKIVITNTRKHQAIHIFAWDHDAVEKGEGSDFAAKPESYRLSIVDATNAVTNIVGRAHAGMNCVSIASISRAGELTRTDAAKRMYKPDARVQELMGMIS